jgi:hypothetical protein
MTTSLRQPAQTTNDEKRFCCLTTTQQIDINPSTNPSIDVVGRQTVDTASASASVTVSVSPTLPSDSDSPRPVLLLLIDCID